MLYAKTAVGSWLHVMIPGVCECNKHVYNVSVVRGIMLCILLDHHRHHHSASIAKLSPAYLRRKRNSDAGGAATPSKR